MTASGIAPLSSDFYFHSPDLVARNLLGKLLIRRLDGESLIARIVETEAYFGQDDPASHSFAGPTARNSVLFGPPGRAYVYFIYGMHYCLNVSCEPDGQFGGVLFRALEPIDGLAAMTRLRNLPTSAPPRLLTSGPGRLCQALAITRAAFNGTDLSSPDSDLQIVNDGFQPPAITVTPRIGISKASHLPLRFFITGNKYVSAGPSKSPLSK
jgi:DNA-3-methyladenine glycosylase